MTIEDVADAIPNQTVKPAVIELGDVSGQWLADQLDEQGVVRLRDALSSEWLDAVRRAVTDRIAEHGDGDLLITEPDHVVGSAVHRLMNDPGLRRLFDDAARRRRSRTGATPTFRCQIPVRNGFSPKARSNLFHYDPSVLTMVIPIFIPRGPVGACGELAVFGNKRPFRRFAVTHIVDSILTHNSVYRRHLLKKVVRNPQQYLLNLQPGDAYVFWGYRQFHGNVRCAPGSLRATLVIQFDDVHAGSWVTEAAWRLSRSRRDTRRFKNSPPPSPDRFATAAPPV